MIGNRSTQNDLLRSQTLGQDLQNKFDDITMKLLRRSDKTYFDNAKAAAETGKIQEETCGSS